MKRSRSISTTPLARRNCKFGDLSDTHTKCLIGSSSVPRGDNLPALAPCCSLCWLSDAREEAAAAFLELLVVYDRMRCLSDTLLQRALEMATAGEKEGWDRARSLSTLSAIHLCAGRTVESKVAFDELVGMDDISNGTSMRLLGFSSEKVVVQRRTSLQHTTRPLLSIFVQGISRRKGRRAIPTRYIASYPCGPLTAAQLLKTAQTFSHAHMGQILAFKIHALW